MAEIAFEQLERLIEQHREREILALLDAHPELVRASGRARQSPLHLAVFARLQETIARLLSKGADINSQDADGDTPLHVAAMYSGPEVVDYLLQHGANPDVRNKHGLSPLAVAVESHNDCREAIADSLIHAGSPLDLNDAVCLMRQRDVQDVLRRDPQAVLKCREPDRLIQDAINASIDTWDILEAVLRHGADPNRHRPELIHPLIYALSSPRIPPEVVRLLLEHGADVHAKGNAGESALTVARNSNPSPAILELLREAGATD
jgi:ankyrin repeat protein